jgi:cell division protein FtsL
MDQSVNLLEQLRDFLRRNGGVILCVAVFLLLLQDVFGTHGVMAMRRSQKEAADIKQEIERLTEENQKLEERVKALKSDPEAIERIARDEMGLAKPGEYIFKVPSSPSEPQPASKPRNTPKR